ncbi:MAG: hypothetical protein LBT59_27540 [Clostridiales bacterium]|jgi:hypothetical protein|nr:hypothetical protein [Clostridiales bacterium]
MAINDTYTRFQAIARAVNDYMVGNGWRSVSRSERSNGSINFELTMNVEKMAFRTSIFVGRDPLYIRYTVTLPIVCSPEYSLIVDDYIATYNYNLRIGSLKHDSSDGALEFEFAYATDNVFNISDFDSYFDICLLSAAKVYPDISKLCVGRMSQSQMNAIMEKLTLLSSAL